MSDHVGIGEIGDNHVVAVEIFQNFSSNIRSPHLGGFVKMGNVKRGYKNSFLSGKGLLLAAVEKVSDMSVLLGLGNVKMPQARCAQNPGKGPIYFQQWKSSIRGQVLLVFSHGNEEKIFYFLAGEVVKGLVAKGVGKLPHGVLAKVRKNERIPFSH